MPPVAATDLGRDVRWANRNERTRLHRAACRVIWWGEVEQSVHPCRDEAERALLFSGRFSEAGSETKGAATQHLMNVRAAVEDRLRWLELDAVFGAMGGKTTW